ncbi:MAG: SAM-dependent methyltransferase [Pyrinomonadaceae bacterium]
MIDIHLDQFIGETEKSIAAHAFVKLTLGKYRGDEADLKNIYARLVEVKGSARLSLLSRYRSRDVVKNYAVAEGIAVIRQILGTDFLSAHLFTLTQDFQLVFNKRREARLALRPPTFTQTPIVAPDREKRRHIELAGNVYLRALGITNERDEVKAGMGDKFRQINKFVETIGALFAASGISGKRKISIVDMGAGKGYLTFAVYDYFNNALGIEASVTGVESRAELVTLCNDIAHRAGFGGLTFSSGFINDLEVGDADILIALHACDTATDDALYKGIAARASLIITAPCCHKELRPQIHPPAVLQSVLRHGHLLEREAETITDSLRALLLESSGYRTKVFEFISTEHTRKNTMIAAVRRDSPDERETAMRQYHALKQFYGIREQRLEDLLRFDEEGQTQLVTPH